MEKQNNTSQKISKPANLEILKIFMQYPDQRFCMTGKRGIATEGIIGVANEFYPRRCKITVGYIEFFREELDGISLLLKPLSKISDQDSIKVCELYNTHLDEIGSIKQKLRVSKDLIHSVVECTDKLLNPYEILAMFDDLRGLGYALPYKNWSVEQLVEFGIYKLID